MLKKKPCKYSNLCITLQFLNEKENDQIDLV